MSKETITSFKSALKYYREGIGKGNRSKSIPKNVGQWLYPIAIEKKYYKFIQSTIKQYGDYVRESIIPMLPRWIKERDWQDNITDKKLLELPAISDIVDDFEEEFEADMEYLQNKDKEIFEEKKKQLEQALYVIAISMSIFNLAQFIKIVKNSTHVTPVSPELWMDFLLKSWVKQNVALCKGLSQELQKNISIIVENGFQKGIHADEIARQLHKKIRIFETYRSRLIARDQISKLDGLFTKKRQEDIGIDTYFWRTVLDERVRTRHKTLHNKLCRWDNLLCNVLCLVLTRSSRTGEDKA